MNTRRNFIKKLATGAAFSLIGAHGLSCKKEQTRPNILLIFSDDQGYNDVGAYGSSIPTPYIDSIGKNGIKFTRFYVTAPVCTPSRFGLLTGRYHYHAPEPFWGPLMPGWHDDLKLPDGEITIADELKSSGYKTGLIGKWHLGHGNPEFGPNNHGFDYFYGFMPGCIDFYDHTYKTEPALYRNKKLIKDNGWSTDLMTDEAIQFIDKNKSDPFFLFLSYNAPHYGKCADGNLLQSPPEYPDLPKKIKNDRNVYAAMVKNMDKNIGRVLDELSKQNLLEQTIVIFLSDNGASYDYGGDNMPLLGEKGTLWEGGIRVPCMIQWPGQIKSEQIIDSSFSSLDFYPTLLGLAGKKPAKKIDGIDIKNILLKNETAPDRRLYFQYKKQKAIIDGKWKFVDDLTGKKYLFDLNEDKSEQKNLINSLPEKSEQLEKELIDFFKKN